MKTLIKRVGAGILGVVMAGSSLLAPAMAATDLADYPAPFVTDGTTDMLVVVGSRADPADVVGAIDLAVRLGSEPGKLVAVGDASTSVSGGKEKEVAINEGFATPFGTLDDSDLGGLIDGKISFNDDDYDVHEEIVVNDNMVIGSTEYDDDFGSKIALLTTSTGAITYSYVFDDPVDIADIGTGTDQDELEIEFLGKSITISAAENASSDEITVKVANEDTFYEDDSVTYNSKKITVTAIGESAIRVDVGGTVAVISEDATKEVNDVKIKPSDIFYDGDRPERSSVTLQYGDSIQDTYSDGDALEIFDGIDDTDDALWVWTIEISDDLEELEYVGISYNQKSDEPDDDPEPVYVGESFMLANDYASIKLDSETVSGYQDYTISFDEMDLDDPDSDNHDTDDAAVVVFKGEDDDAFIVSDGTDEETNTVYLYLNGTGSSLWYKDSDGKTNYAASFNATADQTDLFEFSYEDTVFTVDTDYSELQIVLDTSTLDGEDTDLLVTLDAFTDATGLGTIEDAEATDVMYGTTGLGEKDSDYRVQYGIIVKDPEDNAESDEVVLSVPEDVVKINVIFAGPETEITSADGDTVKEVIPITDSIARLDTDAAVEAAKGSKNLILVGGPAVNMLTYQALGFSDYTYGAASGVPENAAMIKAVDDAFGGGKVALVVAGWNAANTRAACSVLQQYDEYDLSGSAVKVSGTATPYEVEELEE